MFIERQMLAQSFIPFQAVNGIEFTYAMRYAHRSFIVCKQTNKHRLLIRLWILFRLRRQKITKQKRKKK